MAFIPWSSELSVQIAVIDEQHKVLVKYINDLHEAMLHGKSASILRSLISGLVGYTIHHFGMEERYFAEFHYPDVASHQREHEAFVTRISEFQNDFDSGNTQLSIEIMDYLKSWLVNHIQGTDRQYIACFQEHGLK